MPFTEGNCGGARHKISTGLVQSLTNCRIQGNDSRSGYRGFKAMKLGVDIADIIEGVDAAFHIVADYWSDLTRPVKSYDQISRFNYL
ncbi:hypothetical protein WN944_019682 [Citrus x changshan-huyou]|uniref:Uncharacterized protein n=1 Tax=Citrus x changshan-huyou TaxID=2935761 RepID=A0AAP0LWN6_9ROSI